MPETIDTRFTANPVCPHCGHVFPDAFEWGDSGERECGYCDKRFRWERDIEISYTTECPREDSPEGK